MDNETFTSKIKRKIGPIIKKVTSVIIDGNIKNIVVKTKSKIHELTGPTIERKEEMIDPRDPGKKIDAKDSLKILDE